MRADQERANRADVGLAPERYCFGGLPAGGPRWSGAAPGSGTTLFALSFPVNDAAIFDEIAENG
jgi:hypothetical protein